MRSKAAAPSLLLALTLSLCSCGSLPSHRDFAVTRHIELQDGQGGDAVQALAARFYGETLDPAAMRAEVDALLVRYPHDATLHEMAAHLAELREDEEAAWAHWLSAAADLSTPFTSIYLDRAFTYDLTAREETVSIEVLRRMMGEHPRDAVRVDAARRLVAYFEAREELELAERTGRTTGLIRSWKVIGAFDNDQGRGFHAVHPPELEVDFDAELRGVRTMVGWTDVTQIDRAGIVRIGDQVSPDRWVVAYLATHVHSDVSRDVQLRLTTPTATRAWLNGGLVVDQERISRASTDNIVIPVHLERGWNRLLVKSAQDAAGAWVLGARFTDREGNPIPALRYDAESHDVPTVELEALPTNRSPIAEAIEAVEPPLRRQLLTHHDSARNGYEGDALAQARTLLEMAPEHPVVLYHAALTHWTNEELGQTMDLLNQGVERFGDSAGFLWQRGTFYRGRDRYDRAIEDLSHALALEPHARLAAMELASTFEDRTWREHQCRTLEDAIERWPDSAWAIRALGWCVQQRGYLDRAQSLYERADAIEPGHGWNLERLATLARWRGDHGASLAYTARMRRLTPWDVDAMISEADALRYAGRRDEARALYTRAGQIDPTWSRPPHRLGTMAFEDGDDAAALAAWVEALERDPDDGSLADRVDFLRGDDADADRQLMPTDAQIEAAIARVDDLEIDPGAHTVLILDDEVTTVQQDGSSMRRITQVTLAVTTDGRDQLIQNTVPANARILQAYSVSPQGVHQEASSIRGGAVRFRGLETGSRVVLQFVHHDAPPAFLPNHFVSSWVFQGIHRQLGDARWVVQVPAGRELAMHIQGPIGHTVRREGEYDVHVFSGSNVPPLVPEPAMPPVRDLIAMVVLSTLTEWREYVEWERALLSEVFESNAHLRALATRLTQGATTPRGRLDRLYRYVSQEIRYQQDYEDTIAGVRPHSCPVVLERGYGDCKDKAVLMILLGREVGLDIRFAVLRTTGAGQVHRDVPNQQFNHAIVFVPQQDGIDEAFFMDPTTDGLDMGNLRADDQGATSLVIHPDDGTFEFHEIPYQDPSLQYFNCDVSVEVTDPEHASARTDCRVRGAVASMFRRVMRNEERAGQLRQNVAQTFFTGSAVTGAETEHVDDIDHPLELRLTLDASPALQPQGEQRRMRIPSPFNIGRLTRLERRRTPLRLGPPESARWEITYDAPPGGRIARAPADFEIEHPCFTVSRHTVTRGRRATVTIATTRTCAEVAPEDYPELRRLAQSASNQLEADLVFEM